MFKQKQIFHGRMLRMMALSLVWTNLSVAQGISSIEVLAHSCFTCHGPDGIGAGKIPELKGLDKDDITESLYGFKSGDERSTIMGRHAKAYSDEEIESLGKYFSGLK